MQPKCNLNPHSHCKGPLHSVHLILVRIKKFFQLNTDRWDQYVY